MSAVAWHEGPAPAYPVRAPGMAAARIFGSGLLALGVFLSGFVINEPAPFDIYMVGLVGLWAIFGLTISRTVAPLLALLVIFNVGGLIAATQLKTLENAPLYIAVSIFLALISVFFAAIVEADYRRLKLIMHAYLVAAMATTVLGILGYFGAIPGGEQFTLYDRARGAFQDPNVFGPFLVLPALMLIHNILKGRIIKAPLRIAALLLLTFGIFLSFSRAAWGLYALSILLLVAAMVVGERSGLFRLKVMVLALVGALVLIALIAVALQFDAVSDLFVQRAQLVQDYDGDRMGRFERHRLGFMLAMEKPLGIGPMAFGPIYGEDEHNIWLKALMAYGWLGFVAYLTLVTATLALGLKYIFRDRPWQPYLLTAYIVFVGHTLVGAVIDTDHWRHFYMILGMIWGCFALEARWQRAGITADGDATPSPGPSRSGERAA